MDLQHLLPQHKDDSESVEKLYQYSFEELEPIFPQLLEWLQDGNWPIAGKMRAFLLSFPSSKTAPYILEILAGNDYEWKYFVLSSLKKSNLNEMDPRLLEEIQRIAFHPTKLELKTEVAEVAGWVLE